MNEGFFRNRLRDGWFPLSTERPPAVDVAWTKATSGKITVPIQRTVTLPEVPEALARLIAGGRTLQTTVRI
jgi:hypothetical protein